MGNRYGRNQRRAAREKERALQASVENYKRMASFAERQARDLILTVRDLQGEIDEAKRILGRYCAAFSVEVNPVHFCGELTDRQQVFMAPPMSSEYEQIAEFKRRYTAEQMLRMTLDRLTLDVLAAKVAPYMDAHGLGIVARLRFGNEQPVAFGISQRAQELMTEEELARLFERELSRSMVKQVRAAREKAKQRDWKAMGW